MRRSKQTNSLVTARANRISFACLLGLETCTTSQHNSQDQDTIIKPHTIFRKVTYIKPYATHNQEHCISKATMKVPDTAAKEEQPLPPNGNKSPLLTPTDLVDDDIATAQSLDTTSLQTSKHHPDFRVRNQLKILTIANILSDLQLHLSAAQRTQDQSTLDDFFARITKAGEGLSSLTITMPSKQADSVTRKLDGGEMSDACKCMDSSGWYRLEHGDAEGGSEIEAHGVSLD